MKNKIIGYTSGVFDLFHIGHLNLLKQARSRCDYLIIGVYSDETALSYKGYNPTISHVQRLKIVRAIKYVDEVVVPAKRDGKKDHWKEYKFNKYFIGSDHKGEKVWIEFEKELNEVGVGVEYLPHTELVSSTLIKGKLHKTL